MPAKKIETNVLTTSLRSNSRFFFSPKISCIWTWHTNIPRKARAAKIRVHPSEGSFFHLPLHIRHHGIPNCDGSQKHVGELMLFKRAKEKEPHEGTVLFVSLENLVPHEFEEGPGIAGLGLLLYLFIMLVPTLMNFLFENGSVQLRLVDEIPENNRFIHAGLRRQVARRRAAETLLWQRAP